MRTKLFLSTAAAFSLLLSACSGGSAPLKDLAATYAEIADNNREMTEAYQAVYKAPRDRQASLQEKAIATAQSVKAKNEKLAEKAAALGEKLQGKEIKCEASASLGIKVISASFTKVNAQNRLANIVITADIEGEPAGTPYFFLMDGKEVLYKSAARYSDGKIAINFRIPAKTGQLERTKSVMLVTQSEYKDGSVSDTPVAPVSDKMQPDDNGQPEPEAAYQGNDGANSVDAAAACGVEIEKGANLADVLKAAENVSYEYNADSGVWAHVGDVSIVIDEEQLNQQGIDFISTIPSDIEPNLAFSPDYLKPDAKILRIEKD